MSKRTARTHVSSSSAWPVEPRPHCGRCGKAWAGPGRDAASPTAEPAGSAMVMLIALHHRQAGATGRLAARTGTAPSWNRCRSYSRGNAFAVRDGVGEIRYPVRAHALGVLQENAERLLEQRRGKLAGAGAEPGGSSFLQALFADWYFVEVMSIPVILNASVLDGPRVGSGNAGSPCERMHCA